MRGVAVAVAVAAASGAGCGWDFERMHDQPRCEAGDSRPWLPDRRCDQPPPDGAVPWQARALAEVRPPATRALIARGRDRYDRFCATCHGYLGDSDSPVARDMKLRQPTVLLSPQVAAYDDQRIADVIATGYGFMPSYAQQLAPVDRWAVVAYVRVLQRSQRVALDALTPTERAEAERWLR